MTMMAVVAAAYRLEDMAEGALAGQSSGAAAKLRLVFLYHPIPDMGFFHRPFMSFKALSCASLPVATISFGCGSFRVSRSGGQDDAFAVLGGLFTVAELCVCAAC